MASTIHRQLVGILLVTCVSQTAIVARAAPQIESVAVGFNGKYKVGNWVPVVVRISNTEAAFAGDLDIILPDGDGVQVRFGGPLRVPGNAELDVLRYVKFGRTGSGITVELRNDAEVLAVRRFQSDEIPAAAPATHDLVVTAGCSIGVEDALRLRRGPQARRIAASQVGQAPRLPDQWFGYETVDTLVLATSDADFIDALTDRQLDALETWVQLGGRLILCAGKRGGELLAGDGRLRRFAPGEFVEVVAQTNTSGLESFASASQRLDTVVDDRGRFSLPMTLLREIRGRVDAYERSGTRTQAVIVRSPFGFGQVVFVAVDPDAPPIARWQGRPALVARILEGNTRQEITTEELASGQVTHIGYDDMTGQLRGALDHFRGVTLVRFAWVAGLIVLYVAVIGPGDYFLLNGVLKRAHVTWITFPLIVIVFCAAAVVLAGTWKGHRLRINQVDLLDIDAESKLVRGTTWAHLFSPQAGTYDVQLQPRVPGGVRSPGVLLSWQGLPGTGLGAMGTKASAGLLSNPYRITLDTGSATGATSTIAGMPVQTAATKALFGRWWGSTLAHESRLRADANGLLAGTLHNPLPVALDDCLLLYDAWAYRLEGKLAPGEAVHTGEMTPKALDWLLTRRTVVETRDVSTPWDTTSRDLPRIMQIMMFHEAAGGKTYTRLAGRYQEFVDLSEHVRTGKAVLVGRASQPAAELLLDGSAVPDSDDGHWTFVRLVLSVEQES